MEGTKAAARKRTPYDALDNECRLEIISRLAGGERCGTSLAEELGLQQSVVSTHLKRLADAGFVISRTRGKYRYYALNEAFAAPFLAALGANASPKAGTDALTSGVLAQLPLCIVATDLRGTVVLAAGRALPRLGAFCVDMQGKCLFDAFEERKNAIVNLSAAFRGQTVQWEGSSGSARFQLTSMPFKDPRGRSAGVITVGYETPPAASTHLAEEGEWSVLANSVSGAITQVGPDGIIQAHTRSLRNPGTSYVGQNFWNVIKALKKEYQDAARRAIERTIRTGEMTVYHTCASDPGRKDQYFECRVVPHWNEGAIAGVTIISNEIGRPGG